MSNELKCTGGEWKIIPYPVRISSGNTIIATLYYLPTEELEANSNLIAASKDLYNALKDLLYWYKEVSSGRITENYQVAEQAETALQKANTNYKPL